MNSLRLILSFRHKSRFMSHLPIYQTNIIYVGFIYLDAIHTCYVGFIVSLGTP